MEVTPPETSKPTTKLTKLGIYSRTSRRNNKECGSGGSREKAFIRRGEEGEGVEKRDTKGGTEEEEERGEQGTT